MNPIYSGLLERGFSPIQAAVLAGNIQQESSFNPAALNPNEGAFGLLQWRLDRRQALEKLAAERGVSPSDIPTQLDFIKHEMGGAEARNAAPFLAAGDMASANAALKRFIRYGDDSAAQRLKYASAFGGSAQPAQAPGLSLSPMNILPASAPQSAPAFPQFAPQQTAQAVPVEPFNWIDILPKRRPRARFPFVA